MRFAVCVSLLFVISRVVAGLPTIPEVQLLPSSSWITYGSSETDSQASSDFTVHDYVAHEIKNGHYNLATTQHTVVFPDTLSATSRKLNKLSSFKITLVDQPELMNVEPAIRYATSIVEKTWKSEVPVNMRIAFAELGGQNVLANGGGTHFARMRKIFKEIVPIAAAESFLGRDLNARQPGNGHFDVLITVNTNTRWYLGTDGRTPKDNYDLATVLLHEIYHNLIFTGGIYVEVLKNNIGEEYEEAKVQHDLITRFDSFLATSEGCAVLGYLSDTKLQKRTGRTGTQLLAQAVVNDKLFFGFHAFGVMIQLHAPRIFKAKSSIYHIDPRTRGADTMMSPVIRPGSSQHQIGPVILKMQSLFLNPDVKGANPNCPRPLADPKPREITPEDRTGARNNGELIHEGPIIDPATFINVSGRRRLSPAVIITLSVLGGLLLLALCILIALIASGVFKRREPSSVESDFYGKGTSGKPMDDRYGDTSYDMGMPPNRAPSVQPPPAVCRPPSSVHSPSRQSSCTPSSRHSYPKTPSKAPSSKTHVAPKAPSTSRHSYPKQSCCPGESRSHRNSQRPHSHKPSSRKPSSRGPKTHDYFDCS